jgi:thioredoxin 1
MTLLNDKENYSKEILSSPGLRIIMLYAMWSGPCQMMIPVYDEISHMYNYAATFYIVDVDESPSLKTELGIMILPTILFYKNGIVIDFVTGLISRNLLIAKLENSIIS